MMCYLTSLLFVLRTLFALCVLFILRMLFSYAVIKASPVICALHVIKLRCIFYNARRANNNLITLSK
jgi:hypothetical protein